MEGSVAAVKAYHRSKVHARAKLQHIVDIRVDNGNGGTATWNNTTAAHFEGHAR